MVLTSKMEAKALLAPVVIVFIYYAPSVWRALVNNWKVCDNKKYKVMILIISESISSVKIYPDGWHQCPVSSLHWAPPLCDPCP